MATGKIKPNFLHMVELYSNSATTFSAQTSVTLSENLYMFSLLSVEFYMGSTTLNSQNRKQLLIPVSLVPDSIYNPIYIYGGTLGYIRITNFDRNTNTLTFEASHDVMIQKVRAML